MAGYIHPFDDPDIPANPNPRVWVFYSRGEAYDAVQSHEDIHDGDILYVPPARVIGIATSAWPCAYTPLPAGTETDDLHTLAAGHTWEQFAHGRYMNAVTRIRNPTDADLDTYADNLGWRWEDVPHALAYQYRADEFCMGCVRAVAGLVPASDDLRRLHHAAWHYEAALRGIDLSDESNYDSADFPEPLKVPANLQHEQDEEESVPLKPRVCGNCATPLTLNGPPS
ncbi:hypothetical protein SK854_00455 [Lentzea sp. BCCO 10_0061]|uniref:Uncharacterized protein n=1 Tax=Lentzea sokolovensis TaxID=3095429 RepID=A0ABU4UMP3_9PSEU|nr:hypothetical protein [Lentzea sp. BCCO 10_0061]MDX8140565.1 hypothetical protein [Lentzea sp. BCCO 10_0061]